MAEYVLNDDLGAALRHLVLKAHLQDPVTIAHLEAIGVGPGWRCLEIGAGHGPIAAWLCERVGPTGRVVATDIETRFLDALTPSNLEVRRHNLVTDALEPGAFDVVHARDVLIHLPERDTVLRHVVEAVKPGGWVLIEEPDLVTEGPDPTSPEPERRLYLKVLREIRSFLTAGGLDLYLGGRLPGQLRRDGLEVLCADGRASVFFGSPGGTCSPHMTAFAQLRPAVVTRGLVADEEFQAFLDLAGDSSFVWREGLTMSVRGRRPAHRA